MKKKSIIEQISTDNISHSDFERNLVSKINMASNSISQQSKKSPANYIIVGQKGYEMLNILKDYKIYKDPYKESDDFESQNYEEWTEE